MIARSEITNRIPNHGHFEKRECPKKWTHKFIVCLPDCRHIEKGNVPKKWTCEKGSESLKADNS